ncbi:hypothetical protein DIPPA_20226 [Diplonema papillatum]|nr:hypothetical protein DIPPA_20226 [Diplonema papillatum]
MLREAKDQIIHDKQSDKKRTVTDKISGVGTQCSRRAVGSLCEKCSSVLAEWPEGSAL